MALTFTEAIIKTQRLAKDANSDTLTQLKEDWNTGYHMFNAKLARYYSRKQQFTDLKEGQQLYQTPIDSVRVLGMTVLVAEQNQYNPPLQEIRSEYDWRQITSYKYTSNWPAWYFMIGKDQLSLWPIPSQDVTNGLRFYYQPQDHDLSISDTTSTLAGATVSVTQNSTTVVASGGVFTPDMAGLSFRLTGVQDLTWYEIQTATSTTLTLKEAFVGSSGSGFDWQIGQISIIPQEYQDAPMHYALGNYWSAQGNEARSKFHLGSEEDPGMYYTMVKNCLEDYSSSSESSVISDSDLYLNPWTLPPVPNP